MSKRCFTWRKQSPGPGQSKRVHNRVTATMKYILVTGGVISGIGKGVIASSAGLLLRTRGFRVTSIKIDPYLNIDAGTLSPLDHGMTTLRSTALLSSYCGTMGVEMVDIWQGHWHILRKKECLRRMWNREGWNGMDVCIESSHSSKLNRSSHAHLFP